MTANNGKQDKTKKQGKITQLGDYLPTTNKVNHSNAMGLTGEFNVLDSSKELKELYDSIEAQSHNEELQQKEFEKTYEEHQDLNPYEDHPLYDDFGRIRIPALREQQPINQTFESFLEWSEFFQQLSDYYRTDDFETLMRSLKGGMSIVYEPDTRLSSFYKSIADEIRNISVLVFEQKPLHPLIILNENHNPEVQIKKSLEVYYMFMNLNVEGLLGINGSPLKLVVDRKAGWINSPESYHVKNLEAQSQSFANYTFGKYIDV